MQKKDCDQEQQKNAEINEYGQVMLPEENILVITIIGEIEGHECLPNTSKTTKYEHLLPKLAATESDPSVGGILFLIHTSGGDVEAGLAIAEMIGSLSKPTVSLVLGGSHSIGVPLAVATTRSFIVPSANMMIHPVRMSGMVIGVTQTFVYLERMQERILRFITNHSEIPYETLKGYMLDTEQMAKDVGTILDGDEAVRCGLINEIGGFRQALSYVKMLAKNKE